MRVSVIVPLYNKAPHVRRCLESIGAQTLKDFEVIVVDDGSTDASGAVAREFRDPRFQVVSQPNAGPGAARNRGVSLAQGDLLAFLDADDEWFPEFLDQNVRALDQAGPEVATVSSGYIEDPSGINPERMWRQRGIQEGVFSAQATTPARLMVFALSYMSCWNTIIRAEVFREMGGFYSRTRALYAEDAWLWLQVLMTFPVLFRMEPLTRFHREASELSGNLPGVRPVEPFLLAPEPLYERCPPHMRRLLREVLAIRALKTACMLGYWGRWNEAGALRRRFSSLGDFRLPYFAPALVCSTPVGGALGGAWRWLHGR